MRQAHVQDGHCRHVALHLWSMTFFPGVKPVEVTQTVKINREAATPFPHIVPIYSRQPVGNMRDCSVRKRKIGNRIHLRTQ